MDHVNFPRYPIPTKPVEIGTEDWDAVEALWKSLVCRLPPVLERELRSRVASYDKGMGRIISSGGSAFGQFGKFLQVDYDLDESGYAR